MIITMEFTTMKILLILSISCLLSLNLFAQNLESKELITVSSVDLNRYVGTWYEIARLPNRFQEKCSGDVTATYTLLDDGNMKIVNRCRQEDGEFTTAEGLARRATEDGPNTRLEVRFAPAFLSFLPFVWGDYWIIDLASDYSYAVIGEPERRYLWILARSGQMDENLLGEILAKVKHQGYDISSLIRTKHMK